MLQANLALAAVTLLLASAPAWAAEDASLPDADPQPIAYGEADCIHCSGVAKGPEAQPTDAPTFDGDCGGEMCALDGGETPGRFGPDGCIDCSPPVLTPEAGAPQRSPSGALVAFAAVALAVLALRRA